MFRRWMSRRLLGLAVLGLLSTGQAGASELTVSAAASLNPAFRELAPLYESQHPRQRLRLNFGASGALLQQIAKGAPVDVFASADQETMDQAQQLGLVRLEQRRNFAANTLVLVVPAGARSVPKSLADLVQPVYARIAIGLPASVPVGRYTQAALEKAQLWAVLEPKMIRANHVRQALDYVARGEVDAGFVYGTDAALMADKLRLALTVPTETPVLYPAAPVASSPRAAEARNFVAFLLSPVAQAVLAKYGFGKP